MTSKPRFEIHADTRLLYQRLVEVPAGETITYSDLSAVISRKVDGSDYNLQSAIRIARRDDHIYFDNISKVGYRRMTPDDIAESGVNDISRMRRAAKRAIVKQMSVETKDLSDDARRKHLSTLALFGTLEQFTTKKAVTLVTDAVASAGKEIPIAETLRLFSKG